MLFTTTVLLGAALVSTLSLQTLVDNRRFASARPDA